MSPFFSRGRVKRFLPAPQFRRECVGCIHIRSYRCSNRLCLRMASAQDRVPLPAL